MLGINIMRRDSGNISRDDYIAMRLANWARAINSAWIDGPPENARGPGWHNQVDRSYADEETPPQPIDDDDFELVQHAMVRCLIHDLKTATTLTQFYRDGLNVPHVRKSRNLFWRFL